MRSKGSDLALKVGFVVVVTSVTDWADGRRDSHRERSREFVNRIADGGNGVGRLGAPHSPLTPRSLQ